jgi:predicted acyl esterase
MRSIAMWFGVVALGLIGVTPVKAQSFLPGSLQTIATPDGYQLQAYVSVPQGSGPFPVIVMPSSWGSSYTEYVGEANNLANDGYIVISYTSRGFGSTCSITPTCGYIDIAGPLTIGDVSTVITWALANTPANPNEIGVSGISYGAGVSLLAAENDPRIKAVASLSTWADLVAALDANQTPSAQGIFLLSLASEDGKPGTLMQQVNSDVFAGNFDSAVQAVMADPNTPGRSPVTNIAKLNANGPAVFIANAFEDSLFPPDQVVDFYNQLTVPKYLMLEHGDHTTDELLGAFGFSNEVYTAATDWFDHYLKGESNGIDTQQPVEMKSQTNVWSGYANWNAVESGAVTYNLTNPNFNLFTNLTSTGSLSTGSGGNWQYTMYGPPTETAANSGIAIISGALTQWGAPITTSLPLILRTFDAVWTGPKLSTTQYLTGTPDLQITVTPTTSDLSLYAYLYSVNPSTGVAQLMSWEPYTINGATPGVPQTLNIRMEATDWEVDPGQQLALVIGSLDLRYYGVTTVGSAIKLSSSTATPSTLSVSLH